MVHKKLDVPVGMAGDVKAVSSSEDLEAATVSANDGKEQDTQEQSKDAEGGPAEIPDAPARRDSLRRKSSKIANLRKAFENHDDVPVPGQNAPRKTSSAFSTKNREHEADIARLKEIHDTELARSREEHTAELASTRQQLVKETTLRHDTQNQLSKLREDMARLQNEPLRHEACNGAPVEDGQSQQEVHSLQRQLFELKRSIAVGTRIDNQVSDTSFAQQVQDLYHSSRDWTINNFRRAKLDFTPAEMTVKLEQIADHGLRERLRPLYQQYDAALKLPILHATMVYCLLEVFDEPFLYGLPAEQEWCRDIRKASTTLLDTLSPSAHNKWRSITLDALRQSQGIDEWIERASSNLAGRTCTTLDVVTGIEDENSQARVSSLKAILKRAISLAHLFRVQRPRYEFQMPTPGTTFLPEDMEDTSVDADHPISPSVRFAMFPSVSKFGGESGDSAQASSIVVKAKVLCNG